MVKVVPFSDCTVFFSPFILLFNRLSQFLLFLRFLSTNNLFGFPLGSYTLLCQQWIGKLWPITNMHLQKIILWWYSGIVSQIFIISFHFNSFFIFTSRTPVLQSDGEEYVKRYRQLETKELETAGDSKSSCKPGIFSTFFLS